MEILVLGGNKFFGKKLTAKLIEGGHDVTLLNRGNVDDGFGEQISRIKCDRNNAEMFQQLLADTKWDVVFDQICFDYDTAKNACEVFKGKVKKYIFTSTKSVYEAGEYLTEKDFTPSEHSFESKVTKDENYAEGKRQAEVAFSRHASFPVTSVRIPIVLAVDDATGRFQFHVEKIKNNEPIYFPNPDARMTFINSDQVAEAMCKLMILSFEGPINIASPTEISIRDFIGIIEENLGEKALYGEDMKIAKQSPYGITEDWYMDCSFMKSLGIQLTDVRDWLPAMVQSFK